MSLRTTHTYVELEISEAAYKEIRARLLAADYRDCFGVSDTRQDGTGPIDMTGIAVIPTQKEVELSPPCAYIYPGGAQCGYQKSQCMHNGSTSLIVPDAGRHDFIPAAKDEDAG